MTSAAPIGESFSVAIASGVADAGAAFALGENPRVDSTSANCFAGATTLSGAALRSTNSSIAAAQAALDASGKRKGSGGTERSTSSTLSAPAGTGGKGNVKSKNKRIPWLGVAAVAVILFVVILVQRGWVGAPPRPTRSHARARSTAAAETERERRSFDEFIQSFQLTESGEFSEFLKDSLEEHVLEVEYESSEAAFARTEYESAASAFGGERKALSSTPTLRGMAPSRGGEASKLP